MNGKAPSTASQPSGRERGVSDLVAFVLMFAIIITGVGIVSLGAFDNLEEFSDREQIESSERGLSAAAATLDNLHRQNDTRRSFSLALGGGSVYLNESEIGINVTDNSYSEFNETYLINATEHRFDRSPEDITVAYEGGGVFRRPGFGSRYQPSLECTNDTAIVSLVKLEADNFAISKGYDSTTTLNPRGLPGESPVADLDDTLLFSATIVEQEPRIARDVGEGLRINVTESANPEQWEDYLEGSGWSDVTTSDDVYQYECGSVDTVLVRISTVELSL
jgi:hypothetical protein